MAAQFSIKDGNKTFVVWLHEDGTIEIPEYDYDYDMLMVSMGESEKERGPCYWIIRTWHAIGEAIKKQGAYIQEKFMNEMKETYYEQYYTERGFWAERKRSYNVDDLVEFLAEHVLLEQIKDKDPAAETTAMFISKLPVSRSMEPDINVLTRDSDFELGETRYSTYELKIGETVVASWEYAVERRIFDIFSFETEVDDLTGQLDMGPDHLIQAVLDALGITPPEPDPPDEFRWLPESDKTEKGLFGVMYERLKFDWEVQPEDREVEYVDVVIYDDELTAKDALNLAEHIERESGDSEYRMTLVRRKTQSERKADAALAMDRELRRHQERLFESGVEEVSEPDPMYMEWTELEDEDERPEDFEG